MIEVIILLVTVSALIVIAVQANTRLRAHDRLPMQWWLNGEVTWTAPRMFALAFMPAAGIFVLAVAGASTLLMTPRPGQEGLVIPVLLLVSCGVVAIQRFHLWMIDRTFRG